MSVRCQFLTVKSISGLIALAALSVAGSLNMVAQPKITGSFAMFDRNMTAQAWEKELSQQYAAGQRIIILPGCGRLMPSATDSTGYTVDPKSLIYPSFQFPALPPVADNLDMLLSAADQLFGMQVYIGSLQTYGDWSTGAEFAALHKYDPIVAREIIALYGSHPSLRDRGWYFSHELWLNWVKYYGSSYYGIGELATYVASMKNIDAIAQVVSAVVFKEQPNGSMPGLSPKENGAMLAILVEKSDVAVVAPQDGAGAQAGAPPISMLASYYAAMHNALANPINSGKVQLWSTLETFQAQFAGTESANGWQPAPLTRILQQVAAEKLYVSQIVEFMYGWDMSEFATYTPVEADTLLTQYLYQYGIAFSGKLPLTGEVVSYSIAPSSSYPDGIPSKLTNGTGGGFGQQLVDDWVGIESTQSNTVTVTVDLGSIQSITGVHILFAGETISGIYFPQNVIVQYSNGNGIWSILGNPAGQNVGIDTPSLYGVGWVQADANQALSARKVRVIATFSEWLFLGEIKVMEPMRSHSAL